MGEPAGVAPISVTSFTYGCCLGEKDPLQSKVVLLWSLLVADKIVARFLEMLFTHLKITCDKDSIFMTINKILATLDELIGTRWGP